ncbi:MAG: AraC family transcriptional regulator [Verrucomicrobiota bacterium]
MTNHVTGRPYFALSGLPFFAARLRQLPIIFHNHDFLEIALVLGGKAKQQISKYKYEISAGDILIIPVHQGHAYYTADNLEIINMLFNPRSLQQSGFDFSDTAGYKSLFSANDPFSSLAKNRYRLNISPSKFAVVVNLMTSFISEIETKRPGYKPMAISLFIQAIGVISRCQEHISIPPSSLFSARLEQTMDFIETHYKDNITLDQLARLARMSRRSYQRSFRQLMKTSPINHLVNLRIRKAAALLLYHPELNITEIAFQAGFSDSNYFSRMFRKIMGRTPKEFRHLMIRRQGQT